MAQLRLGYGMLSIDQPIFVIDIQQNSVIKCQIVDDRKTRFYYENAGIRYSCLKSQVNRELIWEHYDNACTALRYLRDSRQKAFLLNFDPGSYTDITRPVYPIAPKLKSTSPTESEISAYSDQLSAYKELLLKYAADTRKYEDDMNAWFINFRAHLVEKYLRGDLRLKRIDDIIYKHAYARYVISEKDDRDELDSDFINYERIASEYAIAAVFIFDAITTMNKDVIE